MKIILFSITILLLATNAYGQSLPFDKPAVIVDTVEGALHKGKPNNNYDYYFRANDMLYALSYRQNDGINWRNKTGEKHYRDLLLYHMKGINDWVQASNVVQTDYLILTNWEQSSSKLNYISYGHFGKVLQLKNGCVLMLLANLYNTPEKQQVLYNYNSIVIFVPEANGNYIATHFEPLTKKTRQPEISGTDSLKIDEADNEIKIEVWKKFICKENENPDSYTIYDSDTGGKKYKIYYKKEFITTLSFEISDKKVYYSGTYKMTQTQ